MRQVNYGTASAHFLLLDKLRALRRPQREFMSSSFVPSQFVFVSERGTPPTSAGFARMIERWRPFGPWRLRDA